MFAPPPYIVMPISSPPRSNIVTLVLTIHVFTSRYLADTLDRSCVARP